MFSVTSRYQLIETVRTTLPDGREVVYVRRRFLPHGAPTVVLDAHTVVQGDRLDNVTARYLGDPELYWRICDANGAMRPDELTAPDRLGSVLLVPAPESGAG